MPVPERFLSLAEKLRELGASNVDIAFIWDRVSQEGALLDDHKIHEALKEINPAIAEKFYREMRLKVWRSDLRKEHFNRRRIVESLHREAKIGRGMAEKIAKEVEDKIRSMDISVVTAPLIREIVLGKLLEMGLLDAYNRYMRLGIPVYDMERAMEKGNVEGAILDSILQQYVLFEVLPRDAAELYLDGSWKIWGVTRPHKPYAAAFVYRTPSVKAWVKNLVRYLIERNYVDAPSVHVPKNVYRSEEGREIVNAIDAILWTNEEIDSRQIIKSDVPVYSFGTFDSKVVGDVFEINVGKIANAAKTVSSAKSAIETIQQGIDAYVRFKEKHIKRAEYPVIVTGVGEAERALFVQRSVVEEIVSPLRPFKLEE